MRIGVISETMDGERRVGLVPDVVSRLVNVGHTVAVTKGAGLGAGHDDDSYRDSGAEIGTDSDVWQSDLLVCVRRPPTIENDEITLLGLLEPFDDPDAVAKLLAVGSVTAFAFEAVPRVTRAQPVDALTSQATVAGYQATIEAAARSDRFFPMLTTAAGTVPPARVVVLGAGVAGLQAIATARRLGARVSAFDVRSAAAEQVKSLGATFIDVLDQPQDQSQAGGYAREVSDDQEQMILDGLTPHVIDADVVITTAAIPGRPAPRLLSTAMIESMRRGSVVIDLAAPTGGNSDLTQLGQTIEHSGVQIVGPTDLPSRVPRDASQMYARNAEALIALITGDDGSLSSNWEDEVVLGTAVVRSGVSIHPALKAAP